MGLRGPCAERRDVEEPPWRCRDKVVSRAATHLGARSTCQTIVIDSKEWNETLGSNTSFLL